MVAAYIRTGLRNKAHWWAEFHLDFQIGAITAIHAIPVNTRSRNSCNSSSYYSYSALNEQRIAGIAAVSRVTQARLQRAQLQRTPTRTRMHPQPISCLALCSTHQYAAQQRPQRPQQAEGNSAGGGGDAPTATRAVAVGMAAVVAMVSGAAGLGSCDGGSGGSGGGGSDVVARRSVDHQVDADVGHRADDDGDDEADGCHPDRVHLERRIVHRVGLRAAVSRGGDWPASTRGCGARSGSAHEQNARGRQGWWRNECVGDRARTFSTRQTQLIRVAQLALQAGLEALEALIRYDLLSSR